jgi:hypothetical protein
MHRRTLLGTLAAGCGVSLAGCSRSRVEGVVAANETPLSFAHEYATQATPTGTRVLVEVTAENEGSEPITPDGRVPRITCTFLDGADESLHETGLQLIEPVGVGESTDLEFTLAIDTEDVARYELRSEWVEA